MKTLKFTKEHLLGMGLGIITPLIIIPLVLILLSWVQDYYFEVIWNKFVYNSQYRIRIITISTIINLIWFYYFLNRKHYKAGWGVILGSVAFAPYVIFIKFF